jgi:hypothetical protein
MRGFLFVAAHRHVTEIQNKASSLAETLCIRHSSKSKVTHHPMRALVQLLIVLAVGLAAAPACAELYKWVDERGVTNYSSDPPSDPRSAKKLARIENKLSVYTPDEGFMQAVKALRERSIKALSEPAPERQTQQVATIQPQSPYEQCLASGRPDCDTLYGDYYPAYLPGVAIFRGRPVQSTRFLRPRAGGASRTTVSRSGPARMSRMSPLR